MSTRCYGQGCGLARALDVVGERWTLLIVRELLLGPKRYSDLAERLTGVPTNLLGDRLKQLDAAGLVTRRRLPPPAPATVYELTDAGHSLTPVVLSLMTWGSGLPGGDDLRACGAWVALRLLAADPLPDERPEHILFLDLDVPVTVRVEGSRLEVMDGAPPRADATLATDPFTLHALLAGEEPLDEAIAAGRARLDGDGKPLRELLNSISPSPRAMSIAP